MFGPREKAGETGPHPSPSDSDFATLLEQCWHPNWKQREHAARLLANCDHPDACCALIGLLKDENYSVALAAMKSLIRLRRAAIPALCQCLTVDFESSSILKAIRQILRELHRLDELTQEETAVLSSLEQGKKGFEIAQVANQALIAR